MRIKGGPAATAAENTTLAVVVTDAALTKTQAKRLAMIAQTGFARAIYPVHAPMDGDVVFAAATGERPIDPLVGLTELGMVAANVVARAIARGVYAATALPFPGACRRGGIASDSERRRRRSDAEGNRVVAHRNACRLPQLIDRIVNHLGLVQRCCRMLGVRTGLGIG